MCWYCFCHMICAYTAPRDIINIGLTTFFSIRRSPKTLIMFFYRWQDYKNHFSMYSMCTLHLIIVQGAVERPQRSPPFQEHRHTPFVLASHATKDLWCATTLVSMTCMCQDRDSNPRPMLVNQKHYLESSAFNAGIFRLGKSNNLLFLQLICT